jgi:hypothetical protein
MKSIDIKNVKVKNLIGIIDNPTYEDLLFEIVSFLCDERRFDGEFKTRDAWFKTRVRINSEISDDLDKLVELGYLEKLKYSSYRVIKHLWEK